MAQHNITLSEVASFLGAELRGDGNCVVDGVAALDQAKPGQITFLYDPRYRKLLPVCEASAIVISEKEAYDCHQNLLIVENPRLVFAKLATLLMPPALGKPGIHPTAVIGENCHIAASATIGPHCVLGDEVHIGENTIINAGCILGNAVRIGQEGLLWSHVTIYHGVRIADRVIIHSGAVVGSDGFGFENDQGVWYKIPQLGSVVIQNDVEIGANTTIDRGSLGDTVIETGVKLDNQIQIAHNVYIGAHTIIAGNVGIAGGAHIGKHCLIGGKVGISGHLEIVDQVILTAGAMVSSSITQPGVYSSGIPAHLNREWRKNAVRFQKLDETVRRLNKLEKKVEDIT